MNIPRWAVDNPVTSIMLMICLCCAGGAAWFSLSVDLFPNFDIPVAFIQTPYPGVDPMEMENIVTRKIEEQVNTVENIKKVESSSFEGFSWITVEFTWGTNIDLAAVDLREKVDLAKRDLPRDIEQVTVAKLDLNAQPVMDISLGGDFDLKTLRTVADREIKPAFERISGVANVEIMGGLEREIRVKVLPERLKAMNLTINDVVKAIGNDNRNTPVGNVTEGSFKYLIRAEGEVKRPEDLGRIIIDTIDGRPVYIRDVAVIVDSFKEIESVSRLNLKPAVTLKIKKESGANPVQISDAVKKIIPQLERKYQQKILLTIAQDGSDFIKDSLNMVKENAISGAFLSIIVLFFFLKNIRSTFIIGVSIPLAVIMTFGMMYLRQGMTLNLLTLGGLALGIGMMVDNSIVVLENIYRYIVMKGDAERRECSILGANEVVLAILASTLTTVAVFLPIGFVPGWVGELFINMSLAIVFSMTASFLVAIVLVPMLTANLLKRQDPIQRFCEKRFRRLFARYQESWGEPRFTATVRSASDTLIAFSISLGLTGAFFLPFRSVGPWAASAGEMVAKAVANAWKGAPAGLLEILNQNLPILGDMVQNGLAVFIPSFLVFLLLAIFVVPFLTRAVLYWKGDVDDLVMDLMGICYAGLLHLLIGGWVRRVVYIVLMGWVFMYSFNYVPGMEFFPKMDRGIFLISFEMAEGTSIEKVDGVTSRIEKFAQTFPEVDRLISHSKMAEGNVTVVLKPVAERKRNTGAIIREFRPEIEKIPGLTSFTFGEPKMGGPEGEKPIQIDVSGDDYAVIDKICLDMYEKIKHVKGLKDLVSGVKAGRPEIKIEIDRERIRDLGQDPVALAGMLRSYVFGTLAGKYKEANEEYDIRVEAVDRYKDQIEKVRAMEVLLDKNKPVFLNQIAKVREDRMLSKVRRKNLKRVVSVQADIEGRSIQEIVDEINGILKTMVLPNGYSYTFGGEEEERREAFGNLFLALIAAVGLVYMIMASQFEAIFSPFVIMFTIPLSIIGVFLSLNLYGFNFSITAMIGLIMLAGIVVNNGIILVDYIIRARAEGKEKWDAVRESALLRLRPILMTTLTTVLGMLPLSLGIGAGSDFYQPLAITVIGGLTFSTMMTLTYIPALYMLIDDLVEFAGGILRRFV